MPPGTTFGRGAVSVKTSALTDPTWQSFASRTSTLLAVAGDNPLTFLPALATSTGRPEVSVAPFVPYGLSANGRRAMQTAVTNPARCIAVMPHHLGRAFAIGNEGFNFNRLDG
jgi:hypothetical protein